MINTLSKIDHKYLFKTDDLYTIPHFKTFYDLYAEYVNLGNYPYLKDVSHYIIEKLELNLDENQAHNLGSFVYYVSQQRRKEENLRHEKQMLSEGWEHLTVDILSKAMELKKKLRIKHISTNSLGFENQKDETYKPFFNGKQWFLMRPKARTKGLSLVYFDNAFAKLT